MKHYPDILSEDATLDLMLSGASIARFGDGEWRCAVGGGCTSQRAEKGLAEALQQVLKSQHKHFIVGLPNPFGDCPRRESWIRYTQGQFTYLLNSELYASSFITRPDNAPWIDRPDYWDKVRALWRDQHIVLVTGDKKSITTEMIGNDARSVVEVIGPRQHAYVDLARIQQETIIAAEPHHARILMCLGTAATVLAWRLSQQGFHALDLGHIGMFMRHAGAYRYGENDVTSPYYRCQLVALHRQQPWGADGAKHAVAVEALAVDLEAATILDYGCGENQLAHALKMRRVSGYDPGIPERAKMPKPCELVVCTDVLEHVEPDKLDAVLDHIYRLTGKAAYLVISLKAANATLPDGRNAHLSVHDAPWWIDKLTHIGWVIGDFTVAKDLTVTVRKPS